MYYLLVSEFCEIDVIGPFKLEAERDAAAKMLNKNLNEDGFIWWMDTDPEINVGSYSNAFMDDGPYLDNTEEVE
jgi:hypothetical protein